MTTDMANPTNMRVVSPCPVGGDSCWAVIENDPLNPPCECNYYGVVAAGCPTEADAYACLQDALLEQQCREWERHIRQDEDDEPIPF